MARAADIGRRSTLTLMYHYGALNLASSWKGLQRMLGLSSLHDVDLSDYQAPDSALCTKARSLMTSISPDFLVQHCERTFAFGAILATRNNLKFDPELFYLASILHDLGLTDTYKDDPGSFEWVGARLAYEFCKEQEMAEARADLVHDAVALHASVGIATSRETEVALVHFGAGLDLMGLRLNEVPKFALETVLERFPRVGFKTNMSCCMSHQADTKPDSQIAGHVALGLNDRILEELT